MRGGLLLAIIRTARPRQWIKNLFVAAPLVFAKHLGEPQVVGRALAAVGIFCALSSAVYFWNDVVDVEKDRAHPFKRNRPIPAGLLPLLSAQLIAATLASGSLALAYVLDQAFALTAVGYLALNVAYSLWLKRIVYIDVVTIATGFLLRVLGGALAIDVDASPYLLVCTGLLALFLGFGKRLHELQQAGERASTQRAALASYRSDLLTGAMWLTGTTTLLAYGLYTRAPHTLSYFGTERMIFTTPFVGFGLLRFVHILRRPHAGDSPTEEMLRDVPFMLNIVLFGMATIAIIYWR